VNGKPPRPGEAATAADRTNQRQRHGDARRTRTYAGQLLALDAAAIVASLSVALIVGIGTDLNRRVSGTPNNSLSYAVLATALGICWLLALLVHRCHDADIIGSGSEEFRRIGVASLGAQELGLDASVQFVGHRSETALKQFYPSNCGVAASLRGMTGVFTCAPGREPLGLAMADSRAHWAGWIDVPQILEHDGDQFARDLDHALTGAGHG
jgi:hypothetical protein